MRQTVTLKSALGTSSVLLFFSVLSCLCLLCFVSGMDVKYLSNRYWVCVIYCLILVGYLMLLKLVSRLVGSPLKSNSKGNLATKETWNYV
jgi:hypothetical protein